MKLLHTILLVFFIHTVQSQTIERWEYCRISFDDSRLNTKKNKVFYDFGEPDLKGSMWKEGLKDSTGTTLEFWSPIDVLNYMGEMGWECFSKEPNQRADLIEVKREVYYFKRRKRE